MLNTQIKSILTSEKSLVDASNSNSPITLSQITATQLVDYYKDRSLFSKYSQGNTVLEVSQRSISVMLNPSTVFKNRTDGIGAGTPDKFRLGKQVSVSWNEPLVAYEGLTAQEKELLPIDIASIKLSKMSQDFVRLTERTAFNLLENKAIENSKVSVIDFETKTPAEYKKEIVKLATKLTLTYSPEQGIDQIAPDDILISIHPVAFDYLADAGVVGDRAKETFDGGQYSIGYIGGYKVVSNPFLNQLDVLVAPTFVGLRAVNAIKMYMGPIDNASADIVVRAEIANALGVLYNGLVYGIASSAKTKQNEDKFITEPATRD
ncbi:hypothetical protein ACNF36_02210 [Mycoplasma sp. 4463]|uniref:hypothetical protein n=1 Tax=Mycoplasma sp. 4463 TaxID=3400998 RepID=UPI003AAC853F